MSKKNKKLMCAVYLSVDAPDKEIQDRGKTVPVY